LILLSLPETTQINKVVEVVIINESTSNLFDMSEKEIKEYIESVSISELKKLAISLYNDEEDLYQHILSLLNESEDKVRDAVRIDNLKALQNAVEQAFQDKSEYPSQESFKETISPYLSNIPQDPLAGYIINDCNFGYKYEV
jgi:hypothetical protein